MQASRIVQLLKAEQIKQDAQKQAEQLKQDAEQIKQNAQDFLSEVYGAVEKASNKPVPKKKAAEEIEQLRKENVALKKDLDIKKKDSANLFNLYQEERKKNERAQTAVKIVVDMETAYQEQFHKLTKNSREKFAQPSVLSNKNGRGKDGKL